MTIEAHSVCGVIKVPNFCWYRQCYSNQIKPNLDHTNALLTTSAKAMTTLLIVL